MRTLVWFRNDLRTVDNPALHHARRRGEVVAAFCICNRQWRAHDVGDNRLAFLLDSLHALADDLGALGIPLRLIRAPWFADVPKRLLTLATKVGAHAITFNAEYPHNEAWRDGAVTDACTQSGIAVHVHHGGVILAPGSVLTGQGTPYTVFTPFRRRWNQRLTAADARPLPPPPPQPPPIDSSPLPQQIDGVRRRRVAERWPAGTVEARRRLAVFVDQRIAGYRSNRDLPAVAGTSTLSPYLAVGSLSARQCLAAASRGYEDAGSADGGAQTWIDELVWRDFYRHVTALFPHVSRGRAFRRPMDLLPWRQSPEELLAWQEGRTGYPLVDAGMRQLAATGWMHNRLRMVTAMFLSKHLLLDWRLGERHFMNLLVDGDFAANNGGWQWSASTGTDAAPYFRIFNPHTQARRFDPDGTFVRRWVPELTDAPAAALFDPEGHATSGYPRPIVGHQAARQRALESFRAFEADLER